MKVFKVLSFKEEYDWLPSSCKKVLTHRFNLVKLGLIKDPREGMDKFDGYAIQRQMECQDATLYVQQISEAHHYDRYKGLFLYANAIKFYDGYILPADKVEVFLNSDFHPEHKNITISVSQSRIPKIGQEKVKYIVYRREFETEFEFIDYSSNVPRENYSINVIDGNHFIVKNYKMFVNYPIIVRCKDGEHVKDVEIKLRGLF